MGFVKTEQKVSADKLVYKLIIPTQESKILECYFIPSTNTSSATICSYCGKEKSLHTIGEGVKVTKYFINPTQEDENCLDSFGVTKSELETFRDFNKKETQEEVSKETFEEAVEKYTKESFIPMRNSDGEVLRMPPNQTVPCGFSKHKKIVTKHFTAGAKWQAKQMYTEEELKSAFKIGFNIAYGCQTSDLDLKNQYCEQWFNQFKKKEI